MNAFEIREFLKPLTKLDKENMRRLVEVKTMGELVKMKNDLIENSTGDADDQSKIKFAQVAIYLRAFFEGGVV